MPPRALGQILRDIKKSFLLVGPRQTGKSTLVSSLNPDLSIVRKGIEQNRRALA